jgi:sporulation protein YlmC with PRC-barrel domain
MFIMHGYNNTICKGEFCMKVANLNGKEVVTSEAQVIGEVEGAEVDTDTWKVTHLRISLIKDISDKFNFKKPFFGSVTVSLPVANIKAVGDVIALNKTIEDLKYMREFKIHK